jgi:hypothetical protein
MPRNLKKIRRKIWRAYDAGRFFCFKDITQGGVKTYWTTFMCAHLVIPGYMTSQASQD